VLVAPRVDVVGPLRGERVDIAHRLQRLDRLVGEQRVELLCELDRVGVLQLGDEREADRRRLVEVRDDLVEELEIDDDGTDLDRDFLSLRINEFCDHALEEALQLKDAHGGQVTVLALEAEEPALRVELTEQAARYIRFGAADVAGPDDSAVDPALIGIALAVGVQERGAPFVETLIDRLFASSDAKFRADAVVALGATDDPRVGDRVRELLLDDRLRGRELTQLAFALAGRASQRSATFDWYKANEPAFTGRISSFAHRFLPRLAAGFCTLEERDDVQAFFTPLAQTLQGVERSLAEVLEGIELCAALREARGADVDAYFSAG